MVIFMSIVVVKKDGKTKVYFIEEGQVPKNYSDIPDEIIEKLAKIYKKERERKS